MYLEADNISYFSRDGLHLKQGKELTTVQFIFTVTLIPFSTYPSCHYRVHLRRIAFFCLHFKMYIFFELWPPVLNWTGALYFVLKEYIQKQHALVNLLWSVKSFAWGSLALKVHKIENFLTPILEFAIISLLVVHK